MLRRVALGLIEFYQRYLKGLLPPLCRFSPTCSEYTRQAISRYGFWRGSFKGAWRVLSCQSFSGKAGYHPLV